ncbi:MAG: DUF1778 domain-containing protein [Phycisphaerae bacterium]|jgi:hypothetical protein|nr:DUF1778 domain-containing protein [Phycisphaerae bacterium]
MAKRREGRQIRPENLRSILGAIQGVDLAVLLGGTAAKTERVEFRLSPEEKKLLQMLAKHAGVTMTRLVVALAQVAASGMTKKQKAKAKSALVFSKTG